MEVSKKNLIVLTDYDDFKAIEPYLLEQSDFLAMTPSAMLACQSRQLKYLSPDDFYHYSKFRTDNCNLMQEADELFSTLDRKYKDLLNFPRAFKGNSFSFLKFFSDLHYISKIGREVSSRYKKVYLIGIPMEKDLFTVNLKVCLSLLWFPDFNIASRRGLNLFASCCLSAQCVWFKFNKSQKRFKGINKYQILYLVERIWRKVLLIFKPFLLKMQKCGKRIIFIVVDAYEVNRLKKYLPEFSSVDPTVRSLQRIKDNRVKRLNLKPLFLEEVKEFIKNWFPGFEKYVFELFVLYHSEVLCSLNSFSDNVKETFKCYQPSALFYSIGALSVYEDVYGYFANQMNIPVFFFQHAGAATSAFAPHHFQRYLEHNENINKINILQSKKEKEGLSKNKNSSVNGPALGSIKLYNMYMRQAKMACSQTRRRVLYCPNPFPFYGSYKDCMFNSSDKLLFEVNQSIIEGTHKFNLSMDIKLNRTSHEAEDYFYFKQLIKNQKDAKSRVLTGFPAERIINNYGLFLLDGIVTAMLQMFVVLDVPIILYLKDTEFIYQESMADMRERFYFVKNSSDLESYLSLFAQGKLPSKFSSGFVDKYAFPIDGGDPGIRISNYIREELGKG
ncbi:MAG: hypothetical protein ABIH71_06520 [Candidatus Omnitrophota bacterium]